MSQYFQSQQQQNVPHITFNITSPCINIQMLAPSTVPVLPPPPTMPILPPPPTMPVLPPPLPPTMTVPTPSTNDRYARQTTACANCGAESKIKKEEIESVSDTTINEGQYNISDASNETNYETLNENAVTNDFFDEVNAIISYLQEQMNE